MSDGSRSLTTLTTPHREHQGGGRRRGLGRGRRGVGEDAAVEARAERSTRFHWFGCGVRLPSPQGLASGGNSRGGEASAAAQPAMGGRSMRHDRRCFGRPEQEDQRLKKHYGRWMDIVRSLELESFILTKLTKPFVPVNLVGPQVSLPPRWVPASRGSIHFLCIIRRHFLACEDIAGGSELSAAVTFFFLQNTEALSVGPRCQVEESLFCS